MPLESPIRKLDLDIYSIGLDFLKLSVSAYDSENGEFKKNQFKNLINSQMDFLENLKQKIDTHDYDSKTTHGSHKLFENLRALKKPLNFK